MLSAVLGEMHQSRGRSGRAEPPSTRQIRASVAALNAADPGVHCSVARSGRPGHLLAAQASQDDEPSGGRGAPTASSSAFDGR